MKTKVCKKCKEEKLILDFHKISNMKYGIRNVCKECRKTDLLKKKEKLFKEGFGLCSKCKQIIELKNFYREINDKNKYKGMCKACRREEIRRRYNEYDKSKKKESDKKYYEKNKDKLKKESKKYYWNNQERITIVNKNYYNKNKKLIILKIKKWVDNNKDKVRQYKNKYRIRKRKEIGFVLKERISSSIRNYLYNSNMNKNNISYKKYINFTINQLIQHLENQFDQNMGWNNYGSYWHIDHIIPVSLYDYTNLIEIKKSWNLNNLRPLEAKENISKGNKLDQNLIKKYNLYDILPKGIKNRKLK